MALTSSDESDASPSSYRSQSQSRVLRVPLKIVDESHTQYLVKWAGNDPDTDAPWEDSWVEKAMAAQHLLPGWEREQYMQRISAAPSSVRDKGKGKALATASSAYISVCRNSFMSLLSDLLCWSCLVYSFASQDEHACLCFLVYETSRIYICLCCAALSGLCTSETHILSSSTSLPTAQHGKVRSATR